MEMPSDILKNAEAALALAAALAALGGLLFSFGAYAGAFLFLQGMDSMVGPQIDAAWAAVNNTQALLSAGSATAISANAGLSTASAALAAYSESSRGIGDSLASVSAVPPFSLDSRLSTAAGKLKEASALFANASHSLNNSSSSMADAVSSLRKTADGLEAAKLALQDAKSSFKGALWSLHLGAIAMLLALLLLFSSVLLLSVSILLSHYPRLFAKKKESGPEEEATRGK